MPTSFKEMKKKAFKVKLMNNELPLLKKLKIIKPLIYNNAWKCTTCYEQEEDEQHLWLYKLVSKLVEDIK